MIVRSKSSWACARSASALATWAWALVISASLATLAATAALFGGDGSFQMRAWRGHTRFEKPRFCVNCLMRLNSACETLMAASVAAILASATPSAASAVARAALAELTVASADWTAARYSCCSI